MLRGVNVGGKNKLPMSDLAGIFRDAGCRAVTTYIQSGNVLFEADAGLARRLASVVAAAIRVSFGYQMPVILRSREELREIVEANPFLGDDVDPKSLHVVFLDAAPAAARVSALDPDRSPPDRFRVRGREIFLCCPNGLARSKLTNAYFDSKLGAVSTIRNWNTVRKLSRMSGA
jgi:uncharacterized protein (DUF1697 family)